MRKILEAFFRRRNAIILIVLLAIFLIVAGTYSRTPQYISETRFMIPLGRELGTSTSNVQTQATLLMVNYTDQIATQMEVLNNRRLVENALTNMPPEILSARAPDAPIKGIAKSILRRIGIGGSGESEDKPEEAAAPAGWSLRGWLQRYGIIHEMTAREALVVACASRLRIARQNDSGVIHVRFTHPSPEFGQAFLQKFIEAYESLRVSSGTAGSDMPFYADQEERLRTSLREASNRLAAFRKEWGLLDIQAQRDQYTTELARLDMIINQSRSEETQAATFLTALETEEGRNEPESVLSRVMRDDAGMVHNLRSIAALLARESRLRAEVGKDHPELILIQREMRELRDGLRRGAQATLQAPALNARAMIDEATRQRSEAEDRMVNLESKTVEMKALESEVEVSGDALLSYGKNREIARVSSQMDQDRINSIIVIEPPTRPYSPESPKPTRDIALGIVFSVLLALYYAYFMETFSDTAYTMESVGSKFPGSIVVSVPEVRKGAGGELATPENALSMLGRKFFYKGKRLSIPKSVLVAGSGNKAGATAIALMLARYLATTYNLRVLLVDARLSQRKGNSVGDRDSATLTDWLLDRSRLPKPSAAGGVTVLRPGAGGAEARAAMLRTTPEELAKLNYFDTIIFDAPPLNADSVTFHLAALTEATLPVVWLEHTRKAVLESMNDELVMSGASVLGVVCNRRRFYIPRWIYKHLS